MKKHIFTALIVLIFLVGASVLLYPLVSDYVNARNQSRVVQDYFSGLERLNQKDFSDLFSAAHEYNRALPGKPDRFDFTDDSMEEYLNLLNPNGNRVMGTLEISLIDVHLPIYHGTDEAVLQIGAGHLEGSSLPVGGLGTHTVVTAHRGLPSSTLLTNLDRVQTGDTFMLHILNETLTYRADQILVVEPEDVGALAIEPDKDYCTLVTCTPYGINSHRMLVRGYRIENAEVEPDEQTAANSEETRADNILTILIILSPVLIILVTFLFIRYIKIYGRRNKR